MPLSNYSFFSKKMALPILFCHKSEPSKQYMSFRIIWKKIATIATLATNQELTLYIIDAENQPCVYIYRYMCDTHLDGHIGHDG